MHLREKALNFDLKDEHFWERREAFLNINPMSEVPVLVEETGHVVCDSNPITEYLEEAYPQHNYIGSTPGEHAEVRRIVSWFDNKFYYEVSKPLLFERYYCRFARPHNVNSEIIRSCKQVIKWHLEHITILVARRGWMAGERITLADFAASAHLSCLDYFSDVPWHEFPTVKDWYSLMKSRPSLRAILSERIPVVKPPSYYEDPDF